MAIKTGLALAALLLSLPLASLSKEPVLVKNKSFERTRRMLIDENWQPVNIHKTDGYEYTGSERRLLKKGYHEVESCAMDKPYCIFNYAKNGECLRLITFGEQIKDMKTYQWSDECPSTE